MFYVYLFLEKYANIIIELIYSKLHFGVIYQFCLFATRVFFQTQNISAPQTEIECFIEVEENVASSILIWDQKFSEKFL